jgi:hypothetical protein
MSAKGTTMPLAEIDAQRYHMNEGRQCLACLLESVWHEHLNITTVDHIKDVRLVLVRCHCTRCKATWTETYRLVGVHRDRAEAIKAAEATYKKPS